MFTFTFTFIDVAVGSTAVEGTCIFCCVWYDSQIFNVCVQKI